MLRFGQFYAPEASHTQRSVRVAKLGVAPALGDPDGYRPTSTPTTRPRAVRRRAQRAGGRLQRREDEPMTRREGAAILADALGKKKLRTGLAKVLAKAIGSQGSLLSRSNRISNAKFKAATGWAPAVPSQREGWPLILKEMAR